jgi:hypothetical protein
MIPAARSVRISPRAIEVARGDIVGEIDVIASNFFAGFCGRNYAAARFRARRNVGLSGPPAINGL